MTAPALLLDYPEAARVDDGKCDRCLQHRPRWRHRQTVETEMWHDECDDCGGHDDTITRDADLCPRCWSDTPTVIADPEAIR